MESWKVGKLEKEKIKPGIQPFVSLQKLAKVNCHRDLVGANDPVRPLPTLFPAPAPGIFIPLMAATAGGGVLKCGKRLGGKDKL